MAITLHVPTINTCQNCLRIGINTRVCEDSAPSRCVCETCWKNRYDIKSSVYTDWIGYILERWSLDVVFFIVFDPDRNMYGITSGKHNKRSLHTS